MAIVLLLRWHPATAINIPYVCQYLAGKVILEIMMKYKHYSILFYIAISSGQGCLGDNEDIYTLLYSSVCQYLAGKVILEIMMKYKHFCIPQC